MPPVPMPAANENAAPAIEMGDTHITIQGNADEKIIAYLKRELAQRDAEFKNRVKAIVIRRPSERW